MAIKLTDKPNTEAPSGDYPFGSIRNTVGLDLGTPVSRVVYSDFHQFFERLMDRSGLAHNSLPDNETNGYQLNEALERLTGGWKTSLIFKVSQVGTSDPTISTILDMFGVSISATRLGAGAYEINTTPSLGTIAGVIPIRMISSNGQATLTSTQEISSIMGSGKIFIVTQDSSTPTDGILEDFIIEINGFG